MNRSEIFYDGFWHNNTIFAQLLGMCPLLGVTTSAENGFWMGAATMLVLLGSNLVVSLVRDLIPKNVRIPAYITIIAAFVTVVGMAMNAWMHEMYLVLGLFIPLIVVNCAILGRAEAFASKNSVSDSVVDALAVSAGFTFALVVLGGVRELFGQGELFGFVVFGESYPDVLMFILPPGAFIALGFILAGVNLINRKLKARAAAAPVVASEALEAQT
ncbi:electron transport complex protein RnfE [Mariprofundus ferrinatatus]|uniref:Ion-translocating oxidoreductase complex subunit E n=1 Tax=Mariprofundus ferrinatatus TaxID=1921087 RepID=A0A2K8L5G0_9PROT|nr:electron transport complex subunit E [Mariprofundus ferrinatatus]ATX82550.1 electron transport complex protein RnfE [Mariprofundus ferrinatatus]